MDFFTTVNIFDHLMKDTMDALNILLRVVKGNGLFNFNFKIKYNALLKKISFDFSL